MEVSQRTGHRSQKGLQPAGALGHRRYAPLGGAAQGGGPGVAVRRHPDPVAGQLGRVGEEQKGPAGQGRVEEVLAGAAEDLLGDHHTEADPQRHLPQGDGGGADQGEQGTGHQKAFVQLMAADNAEQGLPEATHQVGHQPDRHKPDRTHQQVVQQAGRVAAMAGCGQKGPAPALKLAAAGCKGGVGLQTGVPEGHEEAGQQGDHHGDHDPFQVQGVPQVGAARGDRAGGVQEAVRRLVERVEALKPAAGTYQGMQLVQ